MTRLGHYLLKYCLIIGAWLLVITHPVLSENLTVSLRVGLSSFTVSGYTAPNAMVTIKQDTVVAGTTTADANGNFSKTISGLESATYTFLIYSADSQGKISNSVEYVVAIGENQNLSLDNLLLPPTLTLSSLDTAVGEDVRLQGESYPGATIRIFLADSLMATTTADSQGRWYGLISNTDRLPGEYHVYVHASHLAGYQSIASVGYTLTLRPRGAVITSPTASPSSELQKSSELQQSDLTPLTTATAPSGTPAPSPQAEGNLIRLILVAPSQIPLLWLALLVIILLFIVFLLAKRRRKRKN